MVKFRTILLLVPLASCRADGAQDDTGTAQEGVRGAGSLANIPNDACRTACDGVAKGWCDNAIYQGCFVTGVDGAAPGKVRCLGRTIPCDAAIVAWSEDAKPFELTYCYRGCMGLDRREEGGFTGWHH